MKKHRVAQVGCGLRGKIHLDSWLANPERFSVEAVCDLDLGKARQAAAERGLKVPVYQDADRMLAEVKPDLFCFSTLPNVRLQLVELAAKHRVKGLVFEKPMATSLNEAAQITDLCLKAGVRAAVSHQQKYLTSFEKLKEVVDSGGIGRIERIEATCQAWLSQLGTHYIDYILWANGGRRVKWVVGHIHGRETLADHHPSPNNTVGLLGFENGVQATVSFGKLSPAHMSRDLFWTDNRMTVRGSHGYAWCDTDGRWGLFGRHTGGEMLTGEGDTWVIQEKSRLQRLFARDMADWLDDEAKVHPCNIAISHHGYEIMEALCLSALDHRRVDLPLPGGEHPDVFERMRRELPECPDIEPWRE
jgi:predicted dehydrogenase